ncbi:MAG: hypothetical protein HUJ61_05295 [Bacilli bacterium]|nr:hypothetical protein [Bacilli bacterium]
MVKSGMNRVQFDNIYTDRTNTYNLNRQTKKVSSGYSRAGEISPAMCISREIKNDR